MDRVNPPYRAGLLNRIDIQIEDPSAQKPVWINPQLASSPPGRYCAGMTLDKSTHSNVLFGGWDNPAIYGDTWIWRNGWPQLFPATSPSARWAPGMAYDEAAGNIVLFGGQSSRSSTVALNDTWTWDGTT